VEPPAEKELLMKHEKRGIAVAIGALVLALGSCGQGPTDQPEPGSAGEFIARMETEHAGDHPVASPAAEIEPAGEVLSGPAIYAELEGAPVTGFVAHPPGEGPFPGVIVIHEWWGLNDNIRAMAERLAGEGYLALAVDLYEGEVAEDRDNASRLARRASERAERVGENLRLAAEHLEEQGMVSRLGVIGWCFGGGWSLRAALLLPDRVDAAVVYYGRVPTDPTELEPLASPVLGIFGALDQGIPLDGVRAFETALSDLGKEASIHVYDDADHAFANPSGTRYKETAAVDAWEKTLAFFDRNLVAAE